jgi:hypothetical protein
MNVQEIINEITKDIDDTTVDNSLLIGWINRCIDEVSPIAKKEAKKTADIAIENAYELPDDLLEVFMVLVNGNRYYPMRIDESTQQGYKIWGNVLSLQSMPDSGAIDLYYYKRLSHVSELTDIPDIDPAFHDLFILYTIGHNQFAEHMDDWQPRQMDALNRYNIRKQAFTEYVLQNAFEYKSENTIKHVYSW